MSYKIQVIKFHPNFKGKVLNYRSEKQIDEFNKLDLDWLYLRGFIRIIKKVNKISQIISLFDYKKEIKKIEKEEVEKVEEQKKTEEVEKIVQPKQGKKWFKKKGRRK